MRFPFHFYSSVAQVVVEVQGERRRFRAELIELLLRPNLSGCLETASQVVELPASRSTHP